MVNSPSVMGYHCNGTPSIFTMVYSTGEVTVGCIFDSPFFPLR